MIYLDYSSNHPVSDEVLNTFVSVEKKYYGNCNSLHQAGKESLDFYNKINDSVLSLLNLDKNEYEVIYTSSATESNNTVIKGIYESYNGFGKRMLASEFEHNSVNAALSYLKDKGADIELVKTNEDGKMSISDLKSRLTKDTILVSTALVESEVGTIQDYQGIQKAASSFQNTFYLCDATQAIGKIPVDLSGLDFVSFAPHKFGGIIGTGVLIKKKNVVLTPLIHGGKSVSIYRSSTFPLGLAASVEKALSLAIGNIDEHYKKVQGLSYYLRDEIGKMKNVVINSPIGNPYILNFSILDRKGGETVEYLSKKGICISQKSACSLNNTPSKTVMAIYHDKKRALSSVRVSLSYLTTKDEINALIEALKEYRK